MHGPRDTAPTTQGDPPLFNPPKQTSLALMPDLTCWSRCCLLSSLPYASCVHIKAAIHAHATAKCMYAACVECSPIIICEHSGTATVLTCQTSDPSGLQQGKLSRSSLQLWNILGLLLYWHFLGSGVQGYIHSTWSHAIKGVCASSVRR